MQTRNYETIYITDPNVSDARVTELSNKAKQIIEGYKGKVYNVDLWGKRKLAYPIRKESKGYYVLLSYSADNACVAELERNFRITEDVFRFLTVKLEPGVDPMAALAEYKKRLEAHARREKERAERDAEKMAEGRGGPGRGRGRRHFEEDAAPQEPEQNVNAEQDEE